MPLGRKRNEKNGHWWRTQRMRSLLFPSTPTGPFCYLKQGKHPSPFAKRPEGTARRNERRFKLKQRELVDAN